MYAGGQHDKDKMQYERRQSDVKKDSNQEPKKPPKGKKSRHNSGTKNGDCSPTEDIVFAKVHKTGSSTVQNILLRYGERHDLKFVLPPRGHHLGYPNYFDKTTHMMHSKEDVYNIFCHHARFSPDVISVMPRESTFISIVRDPVDVFESAFTYFKLDYRMGAVDDPNALTDFLQDPKGHVAKMNGKVHTRNNMLFDFGIPAEDFDDEQEMQRAIKKIDERFDLILIGELFEESLILLRDLLCWTTESVVVFRLNSRNENSVQRLSEDNRNRIKEWNKGDVMLYKYFNETLWKKIESYGREKMAKEVEKLKHLTDKYYKNCVETNQAPKGKADFKQWQPRGVEINGFILKEQSKGNAVCKRMVEPEIQYTEELRQKQFGVTRHKDHRMKRGMMMKQKWGPQ